MQTSSLARQRVNTEDDDDTRHPTPERRAVFAAVIITIALFHAYYSRSQ